MIKKILFSLLPVLCLPSSAIDIFTGPAGNANSQPAVIYRLPATAIDVVVTASVTTFTPGELSRYAERYLRLDDIPSQASETWQIDNISLSLSGVADTSALYTIEVPQKGKTQWPTFATGTDGVLLAVNRTADTETKSDVSRTAAPEQTEDRQQIPDPRTYLTEEIMMAGSTARMAELVAKEIYSIRESRNLITRGQAEYLPADGESAKFFLEQLSVQEQSLMTLFTGKTVTSTITRTLRFTTSQAVEGKVLMRFSSRFGILPSDNLAGEPVWIDVENISGNAQAPSAPAKVSDKLPVIYYKVPGTALIRIYNNRQSFAEITTPFAQFGQAAVVPQSLFEKGRTPVLLFDPITGALQTAD